MRLNSAIFVGPDNGLFTDVLDSGAVTACVHLDRPRFWRDDPSSTFHGRDIFAPIAAHLAQQVSLNILGTPINDPVRLLLPKPQRQPDGTLTGAIIHVDHFGNLISNIPAAWLSVARVSVKIHAVSRGFSRMVFMVLAYTVRCAPPSAAGADQVSGFFADHHARRIGVASGQRRHDGRVDHA